MGIMDFNAPQATAPAQRDNRNQRMPFGTMQNAPEQRDRAKLWLNVGYEVNGRFVNLPIGMPVDTMKPTEVKGQNEDWVKFQTARNQLLEALQHYGMSLAPGEEVEVSTLVIRLRRRERGSRSLQGGERVRRRSGQHVDGRFQADHHAHQPEGSGHRGGSRPGSGLNQTKGNAGEILHSPLYFHPTA